MSDCVEQRVERHRRDAGVAIELVVGADVVREHRRAERAAQPRDRLADVAAADDADDGGGELAAAGLAPACPRASSRASGTTLGTGRS